MSNFEIALKEINDEWLASLPNPEDLPEPKLSKKYLRWERRVIRDKKPVANKVVKIILIAAALLIILSVAALSTDKGKEFILQFFKDSAVYSTYIKSPKLVDNIKIDYIPAGFELEYSFDDGAVYERDFTNGKAWFDIKKYDKAATTDFSFENKTIEHLNYNDIDYCICEDDGEYIIIVWTDENYHYYLGGVISKEDAIKIAKNVS